MKDPEKRVPELRFKGYVEDWEQRKLGDYLTESRLLGTNGSIAKKLTVKLWRKGVVAKEETYQGSAATTYYVRKSGQFIYGKLDFLNQAFGLIPEELDGYESTLDSPAFNIDINLDPYFLLESVSRKQFYLYQGMIANGSRKAKRIHTETFLGMPISIPSLQEQERISIFLKNADTVIALLQEKRKSLQLLKKAILNRIMIQKNTKTPQLNFSDSDSVWSTKKAKVIFCSVSDKNYPTLPVLSATQENGMVYRDQIGINIKYDLNSTTTYKRVLPGQFVIHLRSFQGGFAYSEIEGITSPAYTVLDFINKNENSPIFWKYVLSSEEFVKTLETVTYGIRDGRSISYKDFSMLTFQVPKQEDQDKIGELLEKIENIISLYSAKVTKIKELKDYYLQKMFI